MAILLLLPATFGHSGQAADLAATQTVYKSADRGRSWSRSGDGLPGNARINAFASLNGTVVVGTDAGIYVSRDKGQSWRPARASARILSLAVVGRSLFAGTGGSGILVSSDEGASWVGDSAFAAKQVRSLIAHRDRLYAGTDADGVFFHDPVSGAWTALSQGLPVQAQIFAMAQLKGRLFVALYAKGLFVWAEQERRWTKVGPVSPLVLAAAGETLIVGHNPGGILWSGDLGATWAQSTVSGKAAPGELTGNAPVWEMSAAGGLAVAGASSGIYYSEDHGRTWARARAGLPAESPGISFLVTGDYVLAGVTVKAGATAR